MVHDEQRRFVGNVGDVSTTSARVLFADGHTRLFYQSPDVQDDSNALNIQFKA